MMQVPEAIPATTSWVPARPLCQFEANAVSVVPGRVYRTSRNVCEVKFEPETLTENEEPGPTVVRLIQVGHDLGRYQHGWNVQFRVGRTEVLVAASHQNSAVLKQRGGVRKAQCRHNEQFWESATV
jgi:hypothetical protein